MPSKCCVPKCRGNYNSRGPKVSTYTFPKDEGLRQKWLFSIRRKDFIVTDHSRVCELHFKDTDFEKEISAYDPKTGKTLTAPLHVKRLKKGVVPSLHIQSKASKSTSSSNRETPDQKRLRLDKEHLNSASEQSLQSTPSENSSTKDMTEASSDSRETENEATNSGRRKGIKRKGKSDNEVHSSRDVNGVTGTSYSVWKSPSQSTDVNCSESVNDSALSLQNVEIKEEKPWEEEYNYTVNASLNSDTVKISSVQSCASNENENVSSEKVLVPSIQSVQTIEKEDGVPPRKETINKCDNAFYKKPLKIDKRDEAFGKFVACEMSDLRTNPELYLKTQQSILKIVVEAHFEQMCASNV